MLFGWIIRSGTFAIGAGLIFLLAQQPPRFDAWDGGPDTSLLAQYRGHILTGLSRVRADLQSHGKLLFPARETASMLRPAPAESRGDDL